MAPSFGADGLRVTTMDRVEASDEVVALAIRGRQIEAIKLLREEHGLGLREAKDVVDALRSGDSMPQARPSAGREDGGIARLAIILSVLIIGVLTYYFL